MKKLLVVYNPRSSRHERVRAEVLGALRGIKGYAVGKYEVRRADLDENAKELAKLIGDGDLVVVVGGDGTASMVVNAVMLSGKAATVSALAYGNFNDFAGGLGHRNILDIVQRFEAGAMREIYPLELELDGEHFRYAPCYATVGMAAEAAAYYDSPEARKKHKLGKRPKVFGYFWIALWWMKNRKREFLSELNYGSEPMAGVTDLIFCNGPRMAKVMKNADYQGDGRNFGAGVFELRKPNRLFGFMMKSIFRKMPLMETDAVRIEFPKKTQVVLHTEGEYKKVECKRLGARKGKRVRVV